MIKKIAIFTIYLLLACIVIIVIGIVSVLLPFSTYSVVALYCRYTCTELIMVVNAILLLLLWIASWYYLKKQFSSLVTITAFVLVLVTIVGVATFAYMNFIIRSHVVDSLNLVAGAKAEIGINALAMKELKATAMAWNAHANGKGATGKYVTSVLIDPNTGSITITFDATKINSTFDYIPKNSTLVYTPYVQTSNTKPQPLALALTQGATGNIDWGCASMSNTVAASRGLLTIHMGTLPTKYAPSECR